jgi:hypothetical protein
MTQRRLAKVCLGWSLAVFGACKHEAPPAATGSNEPVPPPPPVVATHDQAPTPPPPTAPTAPAANLPPPSGPAATVNGEHYALNAAVTHPGAVPGDAALTVEVHASDGYHVNNLYPVALDLTPTNATAQTQLRRADVAELSQAVASFRVPVHVTGAGAALRGTMRFAVCSADQCVPHQESFAVAVP